MSWWAHVDFGGDHHIRHADFPPEPTAEWQKFATFTDARNYLVQAGVTEAEEIQDKTRWWRETSKAGILYALGETE